MLQPLFNVSSRHGGKSVMRKIWVAVAAAIALANGTAHAEPKLPAASASPQIIMLRLFVSDLARGEKFYHEVFGMMVVQKMGENVRIMTFPGGAMPGIIMIKSP